MTHTYRRSTRWLLAVSLAWSAAAASAATTTVSQGEWFGDPAAMQFQYGSVNVDFGLEVSDFLLITQSTGLDYGSGKYTMAWRQYQDITYLGSQVNAPLGTATVDTDHAKLTAVASLGGLTLIAPGSFQASGGAVTITDLKVDLASGSVHGKVIGDNGVGTVDDVALWTTEGFSSSTKVTLEGMCLPGELCVDDLPVGSKQINVHADSAPLYLTVDGLNVISKSLGLTPMGRLALDQNTWSSNTKLSVDASFVVPSASSISAVPEPSAWWLTFAGACCVVAAGRKRQTA